MKKLNNFRVDKFIFLILCFCMISLPFICGGSPKSDEKKGGDVLVRIKHSVLRV